MIVTCSKVFRSHSFPLTWFGFSCQEMFLQTYILAPPPPPSNSQYMVSKTNLQNNCLLAKERKVERKWGSFRLISLWWHLNHYPYMMALTYYIYVHCLLVCGHTYIHTYIHIHIWLPHMKLFIKFVANIQVFSTSISI